MIKFIFIAYLEFLAFGTAEAQQDKCSGPQIGTWRLISYSREDIKSGTKTDPLGTHPNGFLSYATDCRMNAILIADERKSPISIPPSDQERINLYSSMLAYAGAYHIEGDNVHHHVDASWNQAWVGSTQSRQFRIEKNTLYIKTFPAKSAIDGIESTVVMVWNKVE